MKKDKIKIKESKPIEFCETCSLPADKCKNGCKTKDNLESETVKGFNKRNK